MVGRRIERAGPTEVSLAERHQREAKQGGDVLHLFSITARLGVEEQGGAREIPSVQQRLRFPVASGKTATTQPCPNSRPHRQHHGEEEQIGRKVVRQERAGPPQPILQSHGAGND